MKNTDKCVSPLTEGGIRRHLPEAISQMQITVYDVTDSTNERAKEFAASDNFKDCAFIADCQTAGRGRLDRRFFSPSGVGLYMSILTGRLKNANDGLRVTAIAAVAVCRAAEKLTGAAPKIKWVNDVYLGGRKLCGILTAGALSEDGRMKYTVSGIGVNLHSFDMPTELREIATTLEDETGKRVDRELFASSVISEFFSLLDTDFSAVCEEYRRRSFLIGKEVTVVGSTESYRALVTGIDEDCSLLVERDGKAAKLSTGEVSIRDFDHKSLH